MKVVTEFSPDNLHGFEVITDALLESMFELSKHQDTEIGDRALKTAKEIQTLTRNLRELEGWVKAYGDEK